MLPKMRQPQQRSNEGSPCQPCCLSRWVRVWLQHKDKAGGNNSSGILGGAAGRALSLLLGAEGAGVGEGSEV